MFLLSWPYGIPHFEVQSFVQKSCKRQGSEGRLLETRNCLELLSIWGKAGEESCVVLSPDILNRILKMYWTDYNQGILPNNRKWLAHVLTSVTSITSIQYGLHANQFKPFWGKLCDPDSVRIAHIYSPTTYNTCFAHLYNYTISQS